MYGIPPYTDVSTILPNKYRSIAGIDSSVVLDTSIYPWGGHAYLAGDYPAGITTVEGVPTDAEILVLARHPGMRSDMALVARTTSTAQGVWRVEGLDPGVRYVVVGRKTPYNDVIISYAPRAPSAA